METVNERLQSEAMSHALDLNAYSNGIVRRLIGLLNRADADLAAALAQALERLPASEFSVERLESLLLSVRALNAQAYAAVGQELTAEMRKLTEYEAGYQFELFRSVLPPQVVASVGVAQVNVEQAYAAAMSRPFQGRLLREWSASIEADRMTRIRDAVRMGFVQQETVQDIVRRVRGTKAKGYSDGIIEIDRRNAEAVVRTAISHTAGFARDRFFEGNGDLVKAQVWTATLDSRTSEVCRPRDGKQYQSVSPYKPIGHSLPWLGGPGRAHWNCRSTAVPVVKSWRELTGVEGLEFSPSERASMDGAVPADLTYGQWLKRQSAARQDQILGPTRGALLRRGGLEVDRFYSDKGVYLTLDQLRERDAAAFKKAGV
jgi:hypothetical protein